MGNINRELLSIKLIEFKNVTEKLIDAVNNNLDEKIDNLFIERQKLINDIQQLQYIKEEFKKICDETNLVETSKKLEEAVARKLIEIKDKMNSLHENSIANKSYIQNSNIKKSFFSTKV